MVEKIIVQPEKVRGGGNIVSPPKTVTDFSLYESSLSLTDNVYTLVYEIQGIVITLSASPVSVTVGESVTFTASVTGDGDPLEGVTVSFKEGSTVIGTDETDSSGVASLVKSDLSVGSHSVVAEYSTGVSSAVSVTVSDVTPVPASVSLTGTKSILSYADSEQCVLTATVLDENDDPMEGVTVTFYNGSTSMGTADTNSSGIASKTYSSEGAGDLVFTAEVGSLVSEIFSISDRLLYDTIEYSRTGTGSATSVATNNKTWDNTIDWELTADIKVTGNSCRIDVVPPTESLKHHLGIGKASNGQFSTYVGKATSGEEAQNHSNTMNNNTYYTVKVVKEGTTIKFYFQDTLIRTDSSTASSWIGNYSTESVKFTTWASNTIHMKNLSVKPL